MAAVYNIGPQEMPTKSIPIEADKSNKREKSMADDSSNSSVGFMMSGATEDASASGDELNIFQAILMGNEEVLEQLLDTTKNDYIVHLKATDSLGRYVKGTRDKQEAWRTEPTKGG